MDSFLVALQTVLPLFLIIVVGMVFSRVKVNHDQWIEVLNKYALWIGFPALVIFSLMQLKPGTGSYNTLVLINSGFLIASLILVFPVARLFRLSSLTKRTLILILPFGNVSYLGIPVLFSAYGVEVLPAAAIISAIYVFWLLTLAVILIEIYGDEGFHWKKLTLSLAQNPLLLSVFVGLAIVAFQIRLPDFAVRTIELFSDSVTAVVLFSLGIFLGIQEMGRLKEWMHVLVLTVVTMLVLPYLFYMMIIPLKLDPLEVKSTILDAAMPLGVTPYVLSIQYKLETTLIARVVVFGTIASVVIIPLWMVILNG